LFALALFSPAALGNLIIRERDLGYDFLRVTI